MWVGVEAAAAAMETERPRSENPAMTFDEVSMERSKSFVKALQVVFLLSLSRSNPYLLRLLFARMLRVEGSVACFGARARSVSGGFGRRLTLQLCAQSLRV